MKMMGYDAVTLGNHEFDNGIDSLVNVLKTAKIDVVNTNFDFSNTPYSRSFNPTKLLKGGGVKIGVFGLGVNLNGLAFQKNFAGLTLKEPIASAFKLRIT